MTTKQELDAILTARIKRCVRVENKLLAAFKEQRSISPDEAKDLAMELGVPDEYRNG